MYVCMYVCVSVNEKHLTMQTRCARSLNILKLRIARSLSILKLLAHALKYLYTLTLYIYIHSYAVAPDSSNAMREK